VSVFADSPVLEGSGAASEVADLDVAQLYRDHAAFVWTSLQRLGIRGPDLEDALQEVFVVVHKRIASFDSRSKVTTWLFGICLRVASAHRRRGFRRNETSVADPPEREGAIADTPEEDLSVRESRRRLEALLDELDLEKRAVFVMFELEEMSCDEIAQVFGVPIGTVYSRLHAARQDFQKALARMHARDARRPSLPNDARRTR
jgi:RNA polymerase sigma-70 factor (ECF subfamily)